MPYRIGATAPLDDNNNVETVFGFGRDPRATYNPGAESVLTLAGTLAYVGYPRATWRFAALTIAQWADLLTLIGDYSGEVYIETRNDIDEWAQWRALARLPEPRTLDRWGAHYREVEVEFLLLEDVTPA